MKSEVRRHTGGSNCAELNCAAGSHLDGLAVGRGEDVARPEPLASHHVLARGDDEVDLDPLRRELGHSPRSAERRPGTALQWRGRGVSVVGRGSIVEGRARAGLSTVSCMDGWWWRAGGGGGDNGGGGMCTHHIELERANTQIRGDTEPRARRSRVRQELSPLQQGEGLCVSVVNEGNRCTAKGDIPRLHHLNHRPCPGLDVVATAVEGESLAADANLREHDAQHHGAAAASEAFHFALAAFHPISQLHRPVCFPRTRLLARLLGRAAHWLVDEVDELRRLLARLRHAKEGAHTELRAVSLLENLGNGDGEGRF